MSLHQARSQDRDQDPDPGDDEFDQLIDSVIRVVDTNSGYGHVKRVKEHVVVHNRVMSGSGDGVPPRLTKRALAFAVKNDRLKRDQDRYWIPGRPDDEDADDYPDFERPSYGER